MGVRLSHLFLALRIFSEMDLSRLKEVPLLDTSFLWLLLRGISAWPKFRSSVRSSLLVLELFELRIIWLWDYISQAAYRLCNECKSECFHFKWDFFGQLCQCIHICLEVRYFLQWEPSFTEQPPHRCGGVSLVRNFEEDAKWFHGGFVSHERLHQMIFWAPFQPGLFHDSVEPFCEGLCQKAYHGGLWGQTTVGWQSRQAVWDACPKLLCCIQRSMFGSNVDYWVSYWLWIL